MDILFEGGSLNDTNSPYSAFARGGFIAETAAYPIDYKVRFRGTDLSGLPVVLYSSGVDNYTTRDSYYSIDGPADDVHSITYIKRGSVAYETTTYRTTSPSQKLTPASATIKLFTGNRHVPVVDGAAAKTVGCYMRKNAGYNGNAPRIMLRRNRQLGVTTDTVVATATLTNADTWYSVSGALPVATDDGVYEVYVDCDGTAGNIFVDDWSIT